jgi:hypothetical protein
LYGRRGEWERRLAAALRDCYGTTFPSAGRSGSSLLLFLLLRGAGGGADARQWWTALHVLTLAMADKTLDDFQRGPGFPLSSLSFEVRRQFPICAQDFLIAGVLFAGAVPWRGGLASFDHAIGSSP